jgi:two-component system NtrC family sensor kinase
MKRYLLILLFIATLQYSRLGLFLTYDMVVKGHGGSIQVNSVEGEGSEFIITLPIS